MVGHALLGVVGVGDVLRLSFGAKRGVDGRNARKYGICRAWRFFFHS